MRLLNKIPFFTFFLLTFYISSNDIRSQSLPVKFAWIQSPLKSHETNDWKTWLNEKSNATEPFEWRSLQTIKSAGGEHIKFELHLYGLPVIGAQANIHIKNNGAGLAVSFASIPDLKTQSPSANASCWFFLENKFIQSTVRDERSRNNFGPSKIRIWEDLNGNIIHQQSLLVYYSDTIGLVSIFNPDPLTKAQVNYGGSHKDLNDQNLNVLQPLQDTAELLLNYSSGVFTLSNFAANISEFDSPSNSVPTSNNGEFISSRSDPEFEMTNALFHITKMKYRIDSLGFDHLVNYSIPVDVNAMNGSDNSAFDPSTSPPSLLFGEGGVDDAEDADVIIHEYSHAISHSAAPNSLFGVERQCLDEALGDYFASSYSRNLNYFNWEKVFSWDGHNEFWSGRSAVNSQMKMYPNISFSGIYEHTDLFVDPLMQLWIKYGPNTVDKLILESIHNWTSGMTFPVAANWVLAADSALFSGVHSSDIHLEFAKWQILNPQASTPSNTREKINLDFFSTGIWSVPRVFQNNKAEITDATGKIMWSGDLPPYLNIRSWKSGIYYLKTSSNFTKLILHKK